MDTSEFRKFAHQLVDYAADYLDGKVNQLPVTPDVEQGFMKTLIPQLPPVQAESYDDVMKDFDKFIMPGVTQWASTHFHAYYPAYASYPSLLADFIANMLMSYNFTWAASPANTELEVVMLDWLAQMMNLPDHFLSSGSGGGVIQGSASEAVLISLAAARTQAIELMKERSPGLNDHDIMAKLVAYTSDQVMGTLGTTASCAFDNLSEIGPICKAHQLWLHVDAAYGGQAFICPEFSHISEGIQYVDSLNVNLQKCLLIGGSSTVAWFKDWRHVSTTLAPQSTPVTTSTEDGGMPSMMNRQIAMGSKFRALKIWFVIRTYGVEGLQENIRKMVRLSSSFADRLRDDCRFQITNNVTLGLVCFRLKERSNDDNKQLLRLINEDRRILVVGATSKGVYFIRFVVTSPHSEDKDMDFAWRIILEKANIILAQL